MKKWQISKSCKCALGLGVVLFAVVAVGGVLSPEIVKADTVTSNATVNVNMSCTMSAAPGTGGTATTDGYLYSTTIDPGTHKEIAGSILTTSCNGTGNYSLYAIGYSGDSYDTPTNTQMVGSGTSAGTNIVTGTATSGGTSNWAFKLINLGSYSPTIISPYNNYANIPGSDFVKVANYIPGTTGSASSSSVQAKYQVYVASNQLVGDYTGKVKYTMVYPNDAPAPSTDPCTNHESELYCKVRIQSQGPQTLAQLRTAITTSNSGVYEYNSSVFGTASDAANTSTIYYYRGILDNTTGSYGSDGDNAAWPNTVVLSSASSKSGLTTNDTCWRIVRTTGSGGVKMIYQGKWTGSTCANATSAAQVTTSAFNGTSSTYQQIVRVGYTHNSTYAVNTSQSGTIAQIFGSNSNPGANNTRSTIKEYIEDTWYANNMTSYTSKLEPSAGYCNDRTMNTSSSWTTPLAESTTIASTYGTSSQQDYYFGAYLRNTSTAQAPSLTCGNKYSQIDRSTVDLYRYVPGSNGTSNQLKYPAALLTTDEAAFAGSGWSSSTTPYHANSFLRSGSYFWLLSPSHRSSTGYAYGFTLGSSGYLSYYNVGSTDGVRPAISLTSGTTATSGTGTAADPWIVNP